MTSTENLSQYDGKKVVVTLTEGGEPLEGTVQVGNELGLLFKPKGKATVDLIEADKIASIEAAPEAPKKLQVKSLQPVKEGSARQHLIDRHGYQVTEIEAMAEADALDFHDGLDHSALGHNHDKQEKAEEAAAEEAAEESAA